MYVEIDGKGNQVGRYKHKAYISQLGMGLQLRPRNDSLDVAVWLARRDVHIVFELRVQAGFQCLQHE